MSLSAPRRAAQRASIAAVTSLSLCLSAACVKHLPASPTPDARVVVKPSPTPPASGYGRLVVDVVDGPTPVQVVRMEPRQVNEGGRIRLRIVEAPQVLCQRTPCVVDPPLGNMLLGFPVIGNEDDLEVELVHIGAQPTAYRRALSQLDKRKRGGGFVMGILGASIGGSAVMTGAALLPIGISKENDTMTWAGGISLGAGVVLTTLGILAINAHADIYRPGSAIHFDWQ